MNTVPFDTLKLARDLETAGLTPPVAGGTAAALADALIGADLATKSDLVHLEARLDARMTSGFAAVDAKFAAVDAKLELLRRDVTIKFGSMLFLAVGILLAAMRLMPHP